MFSLHIDTGRSWRGGQNQVLLTVLGLRARGHRAALVAHPDGALYQRASEGTDLYPIAPKMEMDLHAAWRVSRLVRTLGPDLVHAHDAHGVAVASLARSLGGRAYAVPLVASRRVDFHVGRNAFSRWKYHQVDHFLCASQAIRTMLIGDGVADTQTSVIYEGIDLDRVDHASPLDLHREFQLPAGAPIVGNVAALAPHKGQRYLVDAAALVVRELPDVRFLIVGDGELRDTLTRHVRRLHLQRHVVLTGFRTDVLSILRSLDLFVMSSITEGLGTSVLDAMAAGRAVVTTRAGGLSESVVDGETGLVVPPHDAAGLARAVVELMNDPARRATLGRAGRQRAEERFSAERMVDETVAAYASLADTTREADISRPPAAH